MIQAPLAYAFVSWLDRILLHDLNVLLLLKWVCFFRMAP